MTTASLADVLNILVDDYGIGRRGTNTGTSLSAITSDGDLGGPDAAKEVSAGSQIIVTADGGAAPEGEITQLSTKPKLSTGVANLDPNLTTALANAATFVILRKGLRFVGGGDGVINKINEAQQDFGFIKRILPYTLVTDGDMESSGVSDWTAVSTAAHTKTAATFPLGERVLVVTDSGSAGGYARSVNISVEATGTYYLEAVGYGVDASDAATLVLFDVTNNAAITLSESVIDRMEPERLRNTLSMPAGCKEVQIRLTCTSASDVIHWSYVIFRKTDSKELVLPDTPVRPMDIGRLGYFRYVDWGTRGEFKPIDSDPAQLDNGLWKYRTDHRLPESIWYERFDKPADLAASTVATASTPIPARDLAAVAAEKILFPMRFKSTDWGNRYQDAVRRMAGVVDDYWKLNHVEFTQGQADYPQVRV